MNELIFLFNETEIEKYMNIFSEDFVKISEKGVPFTIRTDHDVALPHLCTNGYWVAGSDDMKLEIQKVIKNLITA